MTIRQPEESEMLRKFTKLVSLMLCMMPVAIHGASAFCIFGCNPTEAQAKSVFENLLNQRFDKPGKIVAFKQTMSERLEMHATGEMGFELFFNAMVEFPAGANLDCKPDEAGKFKEGCSPSRHYVTAPRASDPTGRQYVEPGAKVVFDEEYRFYEAGSNWKAPDGNIYKPA